MIKKYLTSSLIAPIIVYCSTNNNFIHNKEYSKKNNSIILMKQFNCNIKRIWGIDEILIPNSHYFIKYADSYQTRSYINFNSGIITIETVINTNPTAYLRRAIIKMLLMNEDPEKFDFILDIKNISLSKEPFLYKQVLDHTGKPIKLKSTAIKFANYLLENHLKIRNNGLKIIYSTNIDLISNHLNQRAHKYISMIRQSSRKYGVDESLILAIMQTESSFNPYAVSHSDALGLMQLVQNSAGKDVFRIQGKSGTPTRKYLLYPPSNIDTGTAYLAILNNIYFNKIKNSRSRLYAVITAYNSGANSVLRIFSNNKIKAESIINNMSPDDVYATITSHHPSIESRQYLNKVNNAQKCYWKKHIL